MEKPILATNIDGLLISHEAFTEPHEKIWEILIRKTGNKELSNWIGKKDYFVGVNLAMDQIMPKATKEEKTIKVRSWYQEAVIEYIQENPNCINKKIAEKLKNIKIKYKLILMTSNTKKYIDKILMSAGLKQLYDGVIASETEQEPKKSELIKNLFEKYGKPEYYLAGKEDSETNEILTKEKVKIITKEDIDFL